MTLKILPECDDLVEGVNESRDDEECPEEGSGGDPLEAVDDAEEVEEHVQLVNLPEERVRSGPNFRVGEDEYSGHRDPKGHPRDSCNKREIEYILKLRKGTFPPQDVPERTCECLEEPVGDVDLLVAAEPELGAEAVEVLQRLRGHVVEVAEVTHRVQDREEQRRARHDLTGIQTS